MSPNKTDPEQTTTTPIPKPASSVSVADTDTGYESIYSRIDEVLSASRLARNNSSVPRFATGTGCCQYGPPEMIAMSDIEPMYATLDDMLTVTNTSRETAPKNDNGVCASPVDTESSPKDSRNSSARDATNCTKDALTLALMYAKIDITKTIRYRLQMALERNKKNNGSNSDLANCDLAEVIYETITLPEDDVKCWQLKNLSPGDYHNVSAGNVDMQTKETEAKIADSDGNNNEGRNRVKDVSPYENISVFREIVKKLNFETANSPHGELETVEAPKADAGTHNGNCARNKDTDVGSDDKTCKSSSKDNVSMKIIFYTENYEPIGEILANDIETTETCV